MKHILSLFLIVFFTISMANATNYQVDDNALDQLFNTAQIISFDEIGSTTAIPGFSELNTVAVAGDRDPLVAILLDFFLGGLGVHRFYLGTEVMTGVGYILTCGGIFGIVPLVDLIVLVINYDDISMFIDNPAFFMW